MFGAFDRGFWCTSPCHVSHGDYVVQVKARWATPRLFLLNSSQKWELWPFFALLLGTVVPSSAGEGKYISRERLGSVWASLWILFQITLVQMEVSSGAACQLSSPCVLLPPRRWLHGG